ADVIAALRLQGAEELTHALCREVLDGESGDCFAALCGDEGEQQPQRIAIALDRCRAETLLPLQMLFEECIDDRSDGVHDLPPVDSGTIKRPNRSPAD